MPPVLNSDTSIMVKITKAQYRHQIPPLALLMLSFFISFFYASFNMRYPSLALAVIAMAWFLYVGACFRYKQKIPAPEAGKLLSPLTGRVLSLKQSSDLSQLKIAKAALDLVEIRCPHASTRWDGTNLKINYQDTPLIFRLEGGEIVPYPEAPMQPGNIIGIMIGAGKCSLTLPQNLPTELKIKELCEAGVTEIIG